MGMNHTLNGNPDPTTLTAEDMEEIREAREAKFRALAVKYGTDLRTPEEVRQDKEYAQEMREETFEPIGNGGRKRRTLPVL